jgi:hypothetical protein
MKTAVKTHGTTRENPGGMQWRKESLLALKGSRSRIAIPGKDNLWLVTELRLTGRERQLLRLTGLRRLAWGWQVPRSYLTLNE